MAITVAGTVPIPTRRLPSTLTTAGAGGVVVSGVSAVLYRVIQTVVASGGASVSGTAAAGFGGTLTVAASGGALLGGVSDMFRGASPIADGGGLIGGAAEIGVSHPSMTEYIATGGIALTGGATAFYVRPNIDAPLKTVTASLSPPIPYNYISGRFASTIGATGAAQAGDIGITATLTAVSSVFTAFVTPSATIVTKLTKIGAAFIGGLNAQCIAANLPLMGSTIISYMGETGAVDCALPAVTADLNALTGSVGDIDAKNPTVKVAISAIAGNVGSIAACLPCSNALIVSLVGASGAISAVVGLVSAQADAGFGAEGAINAWLLAPTTRITVVAGESIQQLVMVVNTITDAVSTYEGFPFGGFFELGGKYYATGVSGVMQIDVGDTDDGVGISAGLSTGLWTMDSEYQKRVSDAYLTSHQGGDMMISVTVDEAARYARSDVILPRVGVAQLVQRRVPLARGLTGKSWRFEFNNIDGAEFDFSGFGVRHDVSTRRIQGAHNGIV